MTRREGEPTDISLRTDAPDASPEDGVVEIREAQLSRAVRQLLDALDRCAGDPPDCPHCGPARTYALEVLNSAASSSTRPSDERNESAEQERVVLTGRAGSDPSFRNTTKGTLVGRFPLAVHGENNETTWFPVLAFNQRAERLRDVVKRGAPLTVVGYVHTREARTRDGSPRTVQEIYAVTVSEPENRKQDS